MRQLILFWNDHGHITVNTCLTGEAFVGEKGALPEISFFGLGKRLKIGFPVADNQPASGTAALATASVHPVDAMMLKMLQQGFGVIGDLDGSFGKILNHNARHSALFCWTVAAMSGFAGINIAVIRLIYGTN